MFKRDKFTAKIYNLLSNYRLVAAMEEFILCLESGTSVEDHLHKAISGIFTEEEYNHLREIDNWIKYTLLDLGHYMYSIRNGGRVPGWLTEKRMGYYHRAMAEQVNILNWKKKAFRLSRKHKTILDMGCGLSPFSKLFRKYNSHKIEIVGVDKRPIAKNIVSEITHDSENSKRLLNLAKPDVVFFGNSLHCFDSPERILINFFCYKSVKEVIIIDYKANSPQGISLGFHLSRHTSHGGGFGKEKVIETFERPTSGRTDISIKTGEASQQHYFIKITKL